MKETGEKVSSVAVLMVIGAILFVLGILFTWMKIGELQFQQGVQMQVFVQPYIIIACTGVIVFSLGLVVRALLNKQ